MAIRNTDEFFPPSCFLCRFSNSNSIRLQNRVAKGNKKTTAFFLSHEFRFVADFFCCCGNNHTKLIWLVISFKLLLFYMRSTFMNSIHIVVYDIERLTYILFINFKFTHRPFKSMPFQVCNLDFHITIKRILLGFDYFCIYRYIKSLDLDENIGNTFNILMSNVQQAINDHIIQCDSGVNVNFNLWISILIFFSLTHYIGLINAKNTFTV